MIRPGSPDNEASDNKASDGGASDWAGAAPQQAAESAARHDIAAESTRPDIALAASYERCRELHRRHGRTFYLATRLLPAWKRRHVHALYGFTRYTDDIVDQMSGEPAPVRAAKLRDWVRRFGAALEGGPADDPVLPAVLHTIRVFDLDRVDFTAFVRSMEMDLTVTTYETYDDLLEYMAGSAAAIGSMMLPILGTRGGKPAEPGTVGKTRRAGETNTAGKSRTTGKSGTAREAARQLGLAFQLTNFIRDVREDLDRGRIYLPLKDLNDHGVTPEDLVARVLTGPIRDLITFEIDRARAHYALAAPGIAMLEPRSQTCIRAAYRLYGGILDEVERAGYDVFHHRAIVGNGRRLATAVTCLLTPPSRPEPPLAGRAR